MATITPPEIGIEQVSNDMNLAAAIAALLNQTIAIEAGTGLSGGGTLTLGQGGTVELSATEGSGTGTVEGGAAGQLAVYPAAGNEVQGTPAAAIDVNGCLNLAAIADPATAVAGSIWPSTNSGGLAIARAPGLVNHLGGPIWSGRAGTPVANTTARTSVFAGATTNYGSLNIPGANLLPGAIIQPSLIFTTQVTGTPTLSVYVMLGGTTILSGSIAQNAANGVMTLGVPLYITAAGSDGAALGYGSLGGIGGVTTVYLIVPNYNVPVAVNLSGNVTFDVQISWSVASAGNSMQLIGGALFQY